MNKKTTILFIFTTSLIILSSLILILLNTNFSYNNKIIEQKKSFVDIVALPDLAISTEAIYIRHRSLSGINTIFSDGPEYIEYAPSTFSTYIGEINYGNK